MQATAEQRTAPLGEELVTIAASELAALRDSERQLRTIFDEAAIGIRLGDPDGRAIQSNRALCTMLGYSEAELRELSYTDLTFPEEAAEDMRFHEELFRGERTHYRREKRYVHKDGHIVWGSLTVSLVRDESGAPQCIVGMVEDITDRRRAQDDLRERDAQLQQSQKMEAVGQLAGGIAHDFNNLLTVIHAYSELVLMTMQPDDPARTDIHEIRQASERAAGLTRQLLAFSRRQVLRPEALSVSSVVVGLEHMLRRVIGEDVRLRCPAADPSHQLYALADRGQVEQVLVNLAVNARDAMPAGGDLTIAVRDTVLDTEFAAAHPGCTPGRYVAIQVSDTGVGMDEETQKRLFEPFFTTKPIGKGTGLGLAVVYGIVKQSDGYIQVESAPGCGSTFTIYLPDAGEPSAALPVGDAHAAPHTRPTEVILLVEDDVDVRTVATRVLRQEGYTVFAAADGAEALAVAQSLKTGIDLVLTDLVMPQMGGVALIEHFGRSAREPRALIMSGYTEDEMIRRGRLPTGAIFLEKPFTPHMLLERVRDALRG